MVSDFNLPFPKQLDDLYGRRVTRVIDILLERDAQHRDPLVPVAAAVVVQRRHELVNDVIWHRVIDAGREFDEVHVEVELAGLPRQVVRIHWDAMAAYQTRFEGHEAVWLGRRGIDHFPDIEPHAVTQLRDLVDQRDVDVPENVFQEFGHLGGSGGRHRNHAACEPAEQQHGQAGAVGLAAADDDRNLVGRKGSVARIDPFRSEGQEDVNSNPPAPALEDRLHDLLRRPGVASAPQDDQLSLPPVDRNVLCSASDVGRVWFLLDRKRRGHADEDSICLSERRRVRRRRQPVCGQARL